MSAGAGLVKELQGRLKVVAADLRARSEEPDLPWAVGLRAEYDAALAAGRTSMTWSAWRDDEVDQVAVAWVLATVFVRFCEDNGLIDGVWIAGEGARRAQAADAEAAFYRASPERNARDWLREGFAVLADTRAGAGVLDRAHSPVWTAPLGADACSGLLAFWREQDDDGTLRRSLADPEWETRFLGDVYQDLSEAAKKKFALLQTPVFVEEFILDRTLTPALAEFGLEGLRLIDPTCGSGHFLLGAFARLLAGWETAAPGLDRRERVQRALDHVHGVDLNPFAVAIARFRLTVAAMKAAGITRLADAPAFRYHLAVGDSLLAGYAGVQGDLLADADGAAGFAYAAEDVGEHPGILERGRYHVVVGNPPYITVKDKALNEAYRKSYSTCHRQYALSVPFAELFIALAQRGDATTPAGFVGQITSNSFMKREFGTKLIEDLLSGEDPLNPVDLTEVIDTSGAYIPGHGTPTVILVGRRRRPVLPTVRAVLGKRGEPGWPPDPAHGAVWTEIVESTGVPNFDGEYVTVAEMERHEFGRHPWSLAGGSSGELKDKLEASAELLGAVVRLIGGAVRIGADDVYLVPASSRQSKDLVPHWRRLVIGEETRDWLNEALSGVVFPYGGDRRVTPQADRVLWPWRALLAARATFQGQMHDAGLRWSEYMQMTWSPYDGAPGICFAFVATHNHFVLERGDVLFNKSAPVIKLRAGASEDEFLGLLGVLNSSSACFWLKQVSQPKAGGGNGRGMQDEAWEERYEFTGTKLQDYPLPIALPLGRPRRLDLLAQERSVCEPVAVLARCDVSREELAKAEAEWQRVRADMVLEQEELDWEVYRSYGLLDDDFTYGGGDLDGIALGERAFEIALARRVAAGEEESSWFERHGSTPITEIPAHWPAAYRDVVQRRLDLIESDPFINLLERPEYKRRWASEPWEKRQREALTAFVLDRLETAAWWRDAQGPRVLSVAQLADLARADADLIEALRLLTGTHDVDVTAALAPLVREEAVPFLAAYRYKPSGMTKRAEWERVWELQRLEDRDWDGGPPQPIPVPPKYAQADFARPSCWKARGKLDVPKERFVAYPGAGREGDPTDVVGWAGWDHAEQAAALARLLLERVGEGWDTDRLTPLLAGLAELEPWLVQLHAEVDQATGISPAVAVRGLLDQQLDSRGLTRADLAAWRPAPTAGRGRSRS